MHYSDCYELIRKIKHNQKRESLQFALEYLEKEVHNTSFVGFIKQSNEPGKSIFELSIIFDLQQLQLVQDGIKIIINDITIEKDRASPEENEIYAEIENILTNIRVTAIKRSFELNDEPHDLSYFNLAKKYATHFLPFNQSSDPFKGADFYGYCWGHTHKYGQLASQGLLANLSIASDQTLYKTFKTNWTFADILFRRVGWYFFVNQELKIREAIWNAFLQLDEHNILNFNFLINTLGFHSTSLRMVGTGVEYYDNNYGLVRFKNRSDAANFLAAHLLNLAMTFEGEVRFITVYKLPYYNNINHDIFADLPQAKLEQEQQELNNPIPPESSTPPIIHNSNVASSAIKALSDYAAKLSQTDDVKAKIKSNEIEWLVKDLAPLHVAEVMMRLDDILNNKNHSLMVNRGTGFYFFMSGFQSHSTTETLLKAIRHECSSIEHSELSTEPTILF